MKVNAWLSLCVALASCAPDPDRPIHDDARDLAWSKCIFELDKIEALRGRNLDDLDDGHTSARNQFLMDCLAANDAAPDFKHLDEMHRYLVGRDERKPDEMTLNSADRSLPDETGELIERLRNGEVSQESE